MIHTPSKPVDDGPAVAFESEQQAGHIEVCLQGDGETTSHCTLLVKNLTDAPEHLVVPAFECFTPVNGTDSRQTMMLLNDTPIDVAPGDSASADVPTMCVSEKTKQPPTAVPSAYVAQLYKDMLGRTPADLYKTAHELEDKGDFASVPIDPHRRANTLTQLAIWTLTGKGSANPGDHITWDVVAKDIEEKAGLTPQDLKGKNGDRFKKSIDEIIAAVDETIKKSSDGAGNAPGASNACQLR